jgi:hypothetical protein
MHDDDTVQMLYIMFDQNRSQDSKVHVKSHLVPSVIWALK